MSREVFGGKGEDEASGGFSYEKLTKLAPTIYAGTKTTYRLHSIKNKVRSAAEVLKEIERHVPKKLVNEINWRTRTRDVRKETLEIFQELEACLLIGSQRNTKLFKNRPVRALVEKIRSMITNHVSSVFIEREFTFSYAHDAEIFADQVSLEQAIFNVVENSFHFLSNDYLNRREPKIHVDVRQIDGELIVEIVDNANGMDEDERLSARNLYYSGPRKNGSGVGLWMTERIVNDHVGEFDFDSNIGGTKSQIVIPLEVKGTKKSWVEGKVDLLGEED
jgi:signal transduction histidine kinase